MLPARFPGGPAPAEGRDAETGAPVPLAAGEVPVLVVEDSAQDLLLYDHYFRDSAITR